MKKIFFSSLFFILLTGCRPYQSKLNNFAFIFKYGIIPPSEALDTYKWQFTRKITTEYDTTITFHLTGIQTDSIYHKMIEIDFFDYPVEYSPESNVRINPSLGYYFKVTAGEKEKELRWYRGTASQSIQSKKLLELINMIECMVRSNEQYATLPQSEIVYY